MDVSDWTAEQRARFPDYCFGNRILIGNWVQIGAPATWLWVMSEMALPDPAMIWSFGCVISENDHRSNYIRMGLGNTLPTSQAEMNNTETIFPYFGRQDIDPPYVFLQKLYGPGYHIQHRKAVVTGGKKFIVEAFTNAQASSLYAMIYIVVSSMPTSMAGWLAHTKV